MSFEYVDTNAKSGDGANQILTKILQRLNWNASVNPDQPSANVVVTNTPLQVRDTPALPELQGIHSDTSAILVHQASIDLHSAQVDADATTIIGQLTDIHGHVSSADGKLTTTNSLLTTIDADTGNLSGIKTDTALIAARLVSTGLSAAQYLETIANEAAELSGIDGNIQVMINDGIPIKDKVSGVTVVVNSVGEMHTVATSDELAVARTNTLSGSNARTFRVLGRREGFNSTSILQDVGEWLGSTFNVFPELAGTEAMEVVSSDAQDDDSPGGTGTRSVRIVYLDTSYVIQVADVALNGATPVGLGAVRMLFVYWMEALTGGSSEVSVGNIDLRTVAGSVIHERISAGGNKSLSCRFMVPDGFDAYVSRWEISTIGTSQDARLRATVSSYDHSLISRYVFVNTYMTASDGSSLRVEDYFKCPPRAKIKVSTYSGATANTNKIQSAISVLLIAQ
jgi:hypothetical protein